MEVALVVAVMVVVVAVVALVILDMYRACCAGDHLCSVFFLTGRGARFL